MGFCEQWIQRVSVLYKVAMSSIRVNKEMGNLFNLFKSVWQGYPISPYLFILTTNVLEYRSATKGSLMNSGWRPKRSFIGQINDFWTSVTNVLPQNRTFWRQKKLRAVVRVTNLFCFVSGGGVDLVLISKAWQAHKMSFQSQPIISSFFRQLTPQEREAGSATADQKARAEGSAKRPLVTPISAAPASAKRRGRLPSRKFPWCSHNNFSSMPSSHQ